jgi:hypothetical protein
MRYVKITESINIKQLYVQVTCLYCRHTYSFHILKIQQPRRCHCAFATFYFDVSQHGNRVGVGVEWVGILIVDGSSQWEQHRDIDVDKITVAERWEVPFLEETLEENNDY